MSVLRLILGDQLSHSISSLRDCDPSEDIILMCEVWDEATYVKHHKKKIAFIFSAMRHFAAELRQQGFKVEYVTLDEPANTGSFRGEAERCIEKHHCDHIVATQPGEYRVLEAMHCWQSELNVSLEIRPDTRFLCSSDEFSEWAKGRSQLKMEYFYRNMRKKLAVLMDGDKPVGGRWNFDAENRKTPKGEIKIPEPVSFSPDQITTEVMALVERRFGHHFGNLEPFYFAVTREQALMVLERFIEQRLTSFGDFQDAMLEGEPWMYHSHISFYLNTGLLLPSECVSAAEQAFMNGNAPLNAVEGFIRQIIGWREYIRGIYWLTMPEYAEQNYFQANRDLPEFYWTGDCKMNCLKQCITETRDNAYAHHIQRLMVLGNFALIAGIAPKQVNEWFLVVYADAFEWVELPNVSGMILYADGGYLASKPYASGGAYINKMSDYCNNCDYKVAQKTGDKACPFNYLYWDFLVRNRHKLQSNRRISMMYSTYDRMSEEKRAAIQSDSETFLLHLK